MDQGKNVFLWIPAFAGMTGEAGMMGEVGMTLEAGMTRRATRSVPSSHLSIFLSFLFFFVFFSSSLLAVPPSPSFTEHLLAVEINSNEVGDIALFLEDTKGDFWGNQADLDKWGFVLPKKAPTLHKEQAYYELKAFNDLHYDVNRKRMSIHITSPSSHFKPQDVDFTKPSFVIPTEPSPGAYFNYDTLAQKSKESRPQLSGLFSAGYFNIYGTGFTDFVARYNPQQPTCHNNTSNELVRLNSNWRVDDPAEMQSFLIGDSYTAPGMWGRAVGFGGIQWGTNFGTQPSFITFPLPSARGDAIVPSVVDVFLNDSRVGRKETEAGPFTINAIPVTTGAGTLNLVTTDLLGRQQQTSVPYYVSGSLLKAGLQNFSYSAGFIRQNFGIESNTYKDLAFAGNYQLGLTDTVTKETHLEFVSQQQTAGTGGYVLLGDFGIFNLAGAVSHNKKNKIGNLLSVGFQRQALRSISFGTNLQLGSRHFSQLGLKEKTAPKVLLTTFVGMSLYDGASLGISYIRQKNRRWPRSEWPTGGGGAWNEGESLQGDNTLYYVGESPRNIDIVTANYSQSIGFGWALNISTVACLRGQKNKAAFVTLTYALSDTTTLNVGGTADKKSGNQGVVQIMRNLPAGPGYGYNLYAGNGQNANYQASLTGQTETGKYTAAAADCSGNKAGQLQASGALAFMDRKIYPTRTVGDSFAVVQVPGYENVGVYYQNQFMGTTDEDGTLLVPKLLPYQKNPIRVELTDLPLNAQIKKSEMTVIPYYRSGLLVDFPITASHDALMKLVLPSGQSPAAGTMVMFNGEQFPVGYDGEVYVTGAEEKNQLTLKYKQKTYKCSFNVKKTNTNETIPNLGVIKCQE